MSESVHSVASRFTLFKYMTTGSLDHPTEKSDTFWKAEKSDDSWKPFWNRSKMPKHHSIAIQSSTPPPTYCDAWNVENFEKTEQNMPF